MKLRCELMINGGRRKLLLVPQHQETWEHIALKLSAAVLFWDYEPTVDLSLKHPALLGQEFQPDLAAFDDAGGIRLWVECGRTTVHKLDKLTRRYPNAEIFSLKASENEGKRLRDDARKHLDREGMLRVWAWRDRDFSVWSRALSEDTFIYGEAQGRSLNLTINDAALACDLLEF